MSLLFTEGFRYAKKKFKTFFLLSTMLILSQSYADNTSLDNISVKEKECIFNAFTYLKKTIIVLQRKRQEDTITTKEILFSDLLETDIISCPRELRLAYYNFRDASIEANLFYKNKASPWRGLPNIFEAAIKGSKGDIVGQLDGMALEERKLLNMNYRSSISYSRSNLT